MENYRDCVEKHRAEEETYYDKQYEEYLRLNPELEADSEDTVASSNEVVEADAEDTVANSNEVVEDDDIDTWLAEYIEANRIRSSDPKPPLINEDAEDIYVFDGVNIYE